MKPVHCALALTVLMVSPATAQRWGGETGQGNTEAGIRADGVVLQVSCALNAGLGTNQISLSLNGVPANGPITFQPGRRAPVILPFTAGVYAASDAATLSPMLTLLDGLRRSNSATATTVDGQQVRIPLNGSSAALAACPSSLADVANLGAQPTPSPAPETPAPEAPQTAPLAQIPANPIVAVEEALARLGYFPGAMDGQIDDALHVAIATWQRDTGREVTGALMLEDFQALQADAAQN